MRLKSDVYAYKNDRGEHAVFSVFNVGKRFNWLAISSTHGEYSNAWGEIEGDSFKEFLAKFNIQYAATKLVKGEPYSFDPKATYDAIAHGVDDAVRRGVLAADDAANEMPASIEIREDFECWCTAQGFTTEPYRFYRERPGPRCVAFQTLYRAFWPLFAAELRLEGFSTIPK